MTLAQIADDPVTLDLVLVQEAKSGLLVRRDDQGHDQAVWFRWHDMEAHSTTTDRARVTALVSKMRVRGLTE